MQRDGEVGSRKSSEMGFNSLLLGNVALILKL